MSSLSISGFATGVEGREGLGKLPKVDSGVTGGEYCLYLNLFFLLGGGPGVGFLLGGGLGGIALTSYGLGLFSLLPESHSVAILL